MMIRKREIEMEIGRRREKRKRETKKKENRSDYRYEKFIDVRNC